MFSIEKHGFDYANHILRSGIRIEGLMENIGGAMKASTKKRFEDEVDPKGKPWKPTLRGGATLRDTSKNLFGSLTYNASSDEVSWGTNWRWAHVHQFGMIIRPKKKKLLCFKAGGGLIFAKKVTIPARSFIGFNDKDKEIVTSTVINHLRIALGG